jgi:hypothetical protein
MAPGGERAARKRTHSWERDEMLRLKREAHETWFERGSPEGGFLRLLIYVAIGSGVVDERPFNGIKRVMRDIGLDKTVTLARLKESIKRQTFLVRIDEERALRGLPHLIPEPHQRRQALNLARELLALGGPISAEKEGRLKRVAEVLGLDGVPAVSAIQPAVAAAPAVPAKSKAKASPRRANGSSPRSGKTGKSA